MAKSKLIFSLLLFTLFVWGFLLGQQTEFSSEEITIIARFWEKKGDLISATGNVEVHYKDITLLADGAEVDIETKDVFAWGNVTIRSPEENVSCEEMRFNLDSSQGQLKKVYGMVKPTLLYQAESIDRENQDLYGFKKAQITTCTQPVPRWQFSCSKANFKKDDYMEMWNAVLRVKKIPVFYLPYFRYPLNRDRATGFLMPQGGYSGQKGFFYSQGFYWALKRNMDATFNLDYYGDRGLGGGLEYRYLFSEGTGGLLNLYYFRFNKRAPIGSPENAYIVRFKHNQTLPSNFNIVADVDYQSSYDFLREFDNNFRRAVVSNRRSQVYISRAWSYYNFNMRVSRFETYYSQSDDSIIRKNTPQIGFSSTKMKIVSPIYFSFTSLFDNWEYGWESDYEKDRQRSSQSLAFTPTVTVPFTYIPWLTLDSSVSTNFTYYFNSYAPGTNKVVNDPILSHNYSLHVKLNGPYISKIFFDSQNTPKLKHIIEPTFAYKYDSPVDVSDRIITRRFFYTNHFVRYGLVNHFLIKQNDQPREICTLGLHQTYYFDPENSPLSNQKVNGKPPQFSDLSGYFRFYLGRQYRVDFSASYNPYYKTFSRLRLGANLGNITDDLFLRVNWYKSISPYREFSRMRRHQIGLYGGVKIPKLALEAQFDLDFNIIEGEMLYSAVSLVYHYQCIDFKGEVKIFYFRDKPETQIRFSFELGNIGKTTDLLGGFGF
ncbi:MAG: LPS-assembly protein LptD [Candidatus Aminicenantes bacterium]|nr:MAG: LPS-assembly protein LptD [Candidatus Aminicenantes bacterium]